MDARKAMAIARPTVAAATCRAQLVSLDWPSRETTSRRSSGDIWDTCASTGVGVTPQNAKVSPAKKNWRESSLITVSELGKNTP